MPTRSLERTLLRGEAPTARHRLAARDRRRAAAVYPALPAGRYLAIEDGGEVVLLAVEAGTTRIGRGLACEVRLDDATVSRRHALLVARDDGVDLLDDRSSNGTHVNGARVAEARLRHGDAIDLGDVRLRFLDVA
jgi:pSer/pThr/pTyr-binding forkhead associated (FHA) protein